MKRKTVFSLVLIIAFSLVLVPVANADCLELKYDDGIAEAPIGNTSGYQGGVKFSLPLNMENPRLVMARYYIYASPANIQQLEFLPYNQKKLKLDAAPLMDNTNVEKHRLNHSSALPTRNQYSEELFFLHYYYKLSE